MRSSGPLYLTRIQRPKTEVSYVKSKIGVDKLGSIMRNLAKTLNVEGKRISNYSTRKSVVAKLKKAGQPRHKIIRSMTTTRLTKAKGGLCSTSYSTTSTTTRSSETPPGSSSLSVPPTSAVVVLPSNASPLSSAAAVPLPTHQTSLLSSQMPV